MRATLKRHGDRQQNDDELRHWLDEDGVQWDSDTLAEALCYLERTGLIRRLLLISSGLIPYRPASTLNFGCPRSDRP